MPLNKNRLVVDAVVPIAPAAALLQGLELADPLLRRAAAQAMAGLTEAVPLLLQTLQHESVLSVRTALLESLAATPGDEAVHGLAAEVAQELQRAGEVGVEGGLVHLIDLDVVVPVAADLVALVGDAAHQVGVQLGAGPQHEEGGAHAAATEQVEQRHEPAFEAALAAGPMLRAQLQAHVPIFYVKAQGVQQRVGHGGTTMHEPRRWRALLACLSPAS